MEIVRILLRCIDQTLDAWQSFADGDIRYFDTGDPDATIPEPSSKSIIAIRHTFDDIKLCRKDLKYMMDELSQDIPRDVRVTAYSIFA